MGGDGTDRIPRPGRGRLLVEQEAPRPVARPARCTTRQSPMAGAPGSMRLRKAASDKLRLVDVDEEDLRWRGESLLSGKNLFMTDDHPSQAAPQRHEPHQDRRGGQSAVEVLGAEHDQIQALFARVSSPDEDRPAVLKKLLQALANHMAMEKQVLIPVLRDQIKGGAALAERMTDEHDRVEHTLTLLERRKVNSADVPALVTACSTSPTPTSARPPRRSFRL
jgi:hypothetical protein